MRSSFQFPAIPPPSLGRHAKIVRIWVLVAAAVLDVMRAQRKMRSRELAQRVGMTEQNLSWLKSGKVRGVRFDTLERKCPTAVPAW